MTAARTQAMIVLAAVLVVAGPAWWLLRDHPVRPSAAPATGHVSAGTRPHRVTALDVPPAPGAPPERPRALAWTRQFRDAMCACTDAACVRDVDDRFAAQVGTVVFAAEDRELVSATIHESSLCERRVLDRPPPAAGG